ncbi:hypothetical protein [Kitasatospora cineracea]|uniref:hypothetical protein n=1 Tax=Kitasatospora cineracea TaxID=88074 RepID=UPI0036AC0E67
MASSTNGGGGRRPAPLTDLLNSARREGGLSFRQIAARSIDPRTGEGPKLSWLNDLSKNALNRAPEAHMLRALSVGLGYPLVQVQAAAAEQFLEYTSDELSGLPEDARAIVTSLAGVAPAELPRIRAVLQTLIEQSSPKNELNDV